MFYIDGHCDTLSKALDENKDIYINDLQFSINKAHKLGGGIQTLAAFVDTKYLRHKNAGFIRCCSILKKFEDYQSENENNLLIQNKADLIGIEEHNDTKVLLSIENGSAISGDIRNIDYFYCKGVRMMSITWNDDNELGCGANTKNDIGLTKLGIEYVRKLIDKGIIIDVSHASEKTFWDVVSESNKPIVASHSNVYSICNHQRNLKDNQIKAIAKSGGLIGICFYSDFLNSNKRADVKDIVQHIKYIKDLVGIDYIGLGSDFDGMDFEKTAKGVEDISKLNNIIKELKIQGFSCDEIVKIMWTNWLNIMKKILI